MQLRYTLGLELNDTELVPDNYFNTAPGAGNWIVDNDIDDLPPFDVSSFWDTGIPARCGKAGFEVISSGYHAGGNNGDGSYLETATQIFEKGNKYRIEFNICDIEDTLFPDGFYLEIFIAEQSYSISHFQISYDEEGIDQTTLHAVFDVWAVDDGTLKLRGFYSRDILTTRAFYLEYISVKKYEWNNPSKEEQVYDAKLNIQQSNLFSQNNINYIPQVRFWGDDFIYLATRDHNETVYCKIEYYSGGVWNELYIGLIYIVECEFFRNYVDCTIENFASSIIRKNLNSIWDSNEKIICDLMPDRWNGGWKWQWAMSRFNISMHNPQDGTRPDSSYFYRIYDILRTLVRNGTDGYIDLESIYFNFLFVGYTNGHALNNNAFIFAKMYEVNINTSFNSFFQMLDNIYNIGFILKRVNGMNYMKIEPKIFLRSISGITLNDVNNDSYVYNTELLLDLLEIGYRYKFSLDYSETDKYQSSIYKIGEKSVSKINDVSRNSTLIWDAVYTTTDYGVLSIHYLVEYSGTDSVIWPATFDDVPYPYNFNLINDEIMKRWLPILSLEYTKQDTSGQVFAGTESLFKLSNIEAPITEAQIVTLIQNNMSKITLTNSYENGDGYIWDVEIDLIKHTLKGKILL